MKQPGPVTLAVQAMRHDEMAEALADIGSLAADAGESIVAMIYAAGDSQIVKVCEEASAAMAELLCLQKRVQAALHRLEAA